MSTYNPGENGTEANRLLNFFTDSGCLSTTSKKMKSQRDPMMHRIIEKRRRDRMNNCLAELSHLIPNDYVKQGQGRIEKTEIIELSIQYIKDLKVDNSIKGFKKCMAETEWFLQNSKQPEVLPLLTRHYNACLAKLSDRKVEAQAFRQRGSGSNPSTDSGMTDLNSSDPSAMMYLCNSPPDSAYSMQRFMSSTQPWSCKGPSSLDSKQSSSNVHDQQIIPCPGDDTDFSQQLNSSLSGVDSNYGPPIERLRDGNSSSEHKYKPDQTSLLEINDSDNSLNSAYKFKNDITLRFCNGLKVGGPGTSDTSSTDSREDEKSNRLCSSSSSHYPTSEHSSNGGNSSNGTTSICSGNNSPTSSKHSSGSKESHERSNTQQTQTENLPSTAPTPAFALHPSGGYYIPINIQGQPNISTGGKDEDGVEDVRYHPISIMVTLAEKVSSWCVEGNTCHCRPVVQSQSSTARRHSNLGSHQHQHGDKRHKRKDKSMVY